MRRRHTDNINGSEGDSMGEFIGAGIHGARATWSRPALVASLGLALPLALASTFATAADDQGVPLSPNTVRLAQAGPAQTAAPGAAAAQGSASTDNSAALSEVVVTGSRIQRSTFTTPNPVTVLNAQDIANLGITNVGGVLGQLPQNSNFFAANNVGLGNFNVGAQLANLRGLNPFFGTRTLTLVDTERFVPQATGGGVDVTVIPSMVVA
jgi:outer membrane receptor protein involved in Fe transport